MRFIKGSHAQPPGDANFPKGEQADVKDINEIAWTLGSAMDDHKIKMAVKLTNHDSPLLPFENLTLSERARRVDSINICFTLFKPTVQDHIRKRAKWRVRVHGKDGRRRRSNATQTRGKSRNHRQCRFLLRVWV